MAKRERDPETGKFISKDGRERLENIDTQDNVAIFASAGPGTCNIKQLILTMETSEKRTKENPGKKGKTIKFRNGQYKTKKPKEIEFLLWKCDNPKIYSKIKCIQLPEKYKKQEVS